jgi:hypothetical protein
MTTLTTLHILKSEPDDTVADLIEALSGSDGAMVVNLYRDEISGSDVDWEQLVTDIFKADRVISWW